MIERLLFAALLCAAALPAFATTTATTTAVEEMSVKQLLAYHDDVRRQSTTRDYEALSRTERDELASAQAQVRTAVAGKASVAELDEASKATVLEAHAKVVALVAKADDGRLVCTREKKMGSHMLTRQCRTVAQIREERERMQSERVRTSACRSNTAGC